MWGEGRLETGLGAAHGHLGFEEQRFIGSRRWGSGQGWSCGLSTAGVLRALGVPKITRGHIP